MGLGIEPGDLARVNLSRRPTPGELGLIFTALGELLVRVIFYDLDGNVETEGAHSAVPPQRFAPAAVMIFGCVEWWERDGKRIRIKKGGARA